MCFEDPSISPSTGPLPVWFVLLSGYLPPPHIQIGSPCPPIGCPSLTVWYRSLQKPSLCAFYSSSVEEDAVNRLAFRIHSVLKHRNSKDLSIITSQKALSFFFQDLINDISLARLLLFS